MQVIEVRTFRLVEGTDEAAFVAADAEFQAMAYGDPGIVRRTLARADDGEWLVETWWWGPDEAAAGVTPSGDLLAMIDASTVQVRRYETLPG